MQLLPISFETTSWHAPSEERHSPCKMSDYSEAIMLKKPSVHFPTDNLSKGVLQHPKFPAPAVPAPSCESHLPLFKSPPAFHGTQLKAQNHGAEKNHPCYALSKVPTHRIPMSIIKWIYTPLHFEGDCSGRKSNWDKGQSKKMEKPVSLMATPSG